MNRIISLNSFLLSLAINLTLLLILSLCREHAAPRSKEVVTVEFHPPVGARHTVPLQRRPLIVSPEPFNLAVQHTLPARVNVRVAKEVGSPHSNSAVPTGVASTDNPALYTLSSTKFDRSSASSLSYPASGRTRGDSVSSQTTRSGSGGGQTLRRILPTEAKAIITGSGDKLSGYYNISLVKYEDTSDTISVSALQQLAGAMNRWTQVKTKVIKEPMMLDDPELLQVPMVYITSRRPFAFSERERENLRKYFANGGFLLFSNAATLDSDARGVANSIEFELWKVLGRAAHDLVNIDKKHQIYSSFFDLSNSLDMRGIMLDGRISVVYEDSGYGVAWVEGRDGKDKPYLKLGVNIIAYALTTSPVINNTSF